MIAPAFTMIAAALQRMPVPFAPPSKGHSKCTPAELITFILR